MSSIQRSDSGSARQAIFLENSNVVRSSVNSNPTSCFQRCFPCFYSVSPGEAVVSPVISIPRDSIPLSAASYSPSSALTLVTSNSTPPVATSSLSGISSAIEQQPSASSLDSRWSNYQILVLQSTAGAYSRFYKAINKTTQKIVGLKVSYRVLSPQETKETVEEELTCMFEREQTAGKELKHPYITSSHASFIRSDVASPIEGKFVHEMDFIEGKSLFDLIEECNKRGRSYKNYIDKHQKKWLAQVLIALKYLHHEKQWAVKDLKSDNIMIDNLNNNIHLVDFGMARKVLKTQDCESRDGTAYYMAPEILAEEGPYKLFPADIWAFGVLLYEVLQRSYPFDPLGECTEDPVAKKSFWEMYIIREPQNIVNLDADALDLLKKIFQVVEPEQRLSIDQIMQHQFFAEIDWKTLNNV